MKLNETKIPLVLGNDGLIRQIKSFEYLNKHVVLKASKNLSAVKAIGIDSDGLAEYATAFNDIAFMGFSETAVLKDENIVILTIDVIENDTWVLNPGCPVFLANDGDITQDLTSLTNLYKCQEIGIALTGQKVLVQPKQIIKINNNK